MQQKLAEIDIRLADQDTPKPAKDVLRGQQDTLRQEARQLYDEYSKLVEIGKKIAAAAAQNKIVKDLADVRNGKDYAEVMAFDNNKATFQFIFQIWENNNATSTGTVTWPITPGVITLGYSVGDKKQRATDRQVRLISSFREMTRMDCTDVTVPDEPRFPRRYPITGNIGLAEVIYEYMTLTGRKNQELSGTDSYRDKITLPP